MEITDAGGGPNTGTPIILSAIIDINYEHKTVANQVVSKFWANPSVIQENDSDIRAGIVRTTRKPKKPPKGTSKFRKIAQTVLSKKSQ